MNEDDYYTHVPLNVIGKLQAITPERLAQLLKAEADLAAAREEFYFQACLTKELMPYQERAVKAEVDLAAARSRISYLEPIFIAARNLVDNAEEYECDGLGLFAQHGWWEPLHEALDPDGSAAADDMRQPVTPAKKEDGNEIA